MSLLLVVSEAALLQEVVHEDVIESLSALYPFRELPSTTEDDQISVLKNAGGVAEPSRDIWLQSSYGVGSSVPTLMLLFIHDLSLLDHSFLSWLIGLDALPLPFFERK